MPQSSEGPAPRFNLRCTSCGYGVLVRIAPERCPMCGGTAWAHAGPEVLARVLQARLRRESADVRMLFRHLNEELAATASGPDLELVCECGDGRCFAAVSLGREDFQALLATEGHHVVLPGHEECDEEVVVGGPRFAVVAPAEVEALASVAEVQAHARRGQAHPSQ